MQKFPLTIILERSFDRPKNPLLLWLWILFFAGMVLLWLVAFLVKRLTAKCAEHRVLMDFVHPAYTSQTCPLCRISKASNRVAESYKCRCLSFPVKPLDADFVGAFNVRRRFLESVKWYGDVKLPKLKPPKQQAPVKPTHIARKGVAP